MPPKKRHENRLFEHLQDYATLYPSIIPRIRAAAAGGNSYARKAIESFAEAGLKAELRHIERCRTLLGLTEAQARLALFIAEGGTVTEYAATMRIGVSTARSHLKAVFTKTGTRRQAELAVLVLGRLR